MKKFWLFLFLIVTIPVIASAASFFKEMPKSVYPIYPMTVYLERYRVEYLMHRDEEIREDYSKALISATKNTQQEGDTIFPYLIIKNFLIKPIPFKVRRDKDLLEIVQESRNDLLEELVDQAKDSELLLSKREVAVKMLGQIAISKLEKIDWNEKAMKGLKDIASGKNPVLIHTALIYLTKLAIKEGVVWEDVREGAADALANVIKQDDDQELKKLAFLETIQALKKATQKNDATETLWEALEGEIDSIKSPAHQVLLRKKLIELLNLKSRTIFRELAKDVKDELKDWENLREIVKNPLKEVLEDIQTNKDEKELEGSITKALEDIEKDRSLQFLVFTSFAKNMSQQEQSFYRVRLFGSALIRLTHQSKSPLFFYRTASVLLGLVSIHKDKPVANIPMILLGDLLSSTDSAGLLLPILNEIDSVLKSSSIPVWIKKRLVSLLFLQAANSTNSTVRQTAFNLLKNSSKSASLNAVRWVALKRIQQLGLYAKDGRIQQAAKNWK
ncbi:MAG: hypothetical protein ACI86H_001803 [bacterium]|jgi:hypothetical protein